MASYVSLFYQVRFLFFYGLLSGVFCLTAYDKSMAQENSAPKAEHDVPAVKTNTRGKTVQKTLRIPPDSERAAAVDSADDIFKSLDYPELQVVPRATDRLQFEAQNESENKFLAHWPIILPSLATLYLGYSAKGEYKDDASKSDKDNADLSANAAMAVGGFWIAATGFISWTKPYRTGINRVRKNREEDKRGELFRERLSEETLEGQAKTMRVLSNLSVATNLLLAISVGSQSDISDTQVAVTALLAFTPWVFEHRSVSVWDKHLEYKRKIYTPISSMNLKFEDHTKRFYPLMSLRWDF